MLVRIKMWLFEGAIGVLVLGSLGMYYLTFLFKKWKFVKFSWQINGFLLPILPFVGTSYLALLNGLKVNPIVFMQWGHKYLSFPVSFWFGHTYNYITCDSEEAGIILNHPKCYDKSPFYDKLSYLFGKTLVFAPRELWKNRRKHFMKSFKPNLLKRAVPIYYRQSCELIEEMKTVKIFDIFKIFNEYSLTNFFLNNIDQVESQIPDIQHLGNLIKEVQSLLCEIMLNPVVPDGIWHSWFPSGRKVGELMAEAKECTTTLFIEKLKDYKDIKRYVENSKEVNLIDLMVTSSDDKLLSQDEIVQELHIFAAAATDTSGFTMSCCFLLLGMHPGIQEKVYKEVSEIVGEHEISYDTLQDLVYTEAVILETLRIFPVVPIVGRSCAENISLGKRTLPKGTSCLISIFHIQRDPDNWPDPLNFDPTRFLPENQSKIKPYSFLGFSGGPRDCIGKRQAMLLIKLTVANVVRNFTISSKHKSINEFEVNSSLLMRITNKIDCHFEPRYKC